MAGWSPAEIYRSESRESHVEPYRVYEKLGEGEMNGVFYTELQEGRLIAIKLDGPFKFLTREEIEENRWEEVGKVDEDKVKRYLEDRFMGNMPDISKRIKRRRSRLRKKLARAG